MTLDFRSRGLSVFASTVARYYDIDTDSFVHVKPGFRAAFHFRKNGKTHTWVWNGLTVRKARDVVSAA